MKATSGNAELLGAVYQSNWKIALDYSAEDFRSYDEAAEGMGPTVRRNDLRHCRELIAVTNLGFDMAMDVKFHCNEAVNVAIEYFCGDYLRNDVKSAKKLDPSSDQLQWSEVFSIGVFFALLTDNEKAVNKIASWVQPEFTDNDAWINFKDTDHFYWKVLAAKLSGAEWSTDEYQDKIKNSKRSRAKSLLGALLAICDMDDAGFETHLNKHLEQYLKSELDRETIFCWFSLDGSILWHFAKRSGLAMPTLSPKKNALIVTCDSLGLS